MRVRGRTRGTPPAARDVRLGPTTVSAITVERAADIVFGLMEEARPHLVVTPNVDHLVLLERDSEFAAAYGQASLRVPDGAPLLLLARMLHTPLAGRVAGVDLTLAVLDAANVAGRSVFFLGGRPDTLGRALDVVARRWPGLASAEGAAPDIDLDRVSDSEAAALERMRATSPDVLVLCLGAPKQEKWFVRRREQLPPTVALAVGGAVDLIAGAKPRAPRVLQSCGLEWTWRLAHEPRRLAGRYLVRDPAFLQIATRELWHRRMGTA